MSADFGRQHKSICDPRVQPPGVVDWRLQGQPLARVVATFNPAAHGAWPAQDFPRENHAIAWKLAEWVVRSVEQCTRSKVMMYYTFGRWPAGGAAFEIMQIIGGESGERVPTCCASHVVRRLKDPVPTPSSGKVRICKILAHEVSD